MSACTWKRISVVAWSMALWPVLSLSAQEDNVGIVRISDASKGRVQPAGYRKAGKYGAEMYGDFAGGDCPECRPGRGCPHCFGAGCAHCKHHGCLHCLGGKFQEHYCTNSPDYGFSIPGKYPIHRRGVQYNQYFPHQWYGANGALAADVVYPMVYQPTDTAQLGFYYQHVPFWMPQPNPLPARPLPAHWHHYAPAVTASAFHHAGGYAVGAGEIYTDGTVISVDGGVVVPTPAPVELQPVPTTEPAPAPKPPAESAIELPFRRASYE